MEAREVGLPLLSDVPDRAKGAVNRLVALFTAGSPFGSCRNRLTALGQRVDGGIALHELDVIDVVERKPPDWDWRESAVGHWLAPFNLAMYSPKEARNSSKSVPNG